MIWADHVLTPDGWARDVLLEWDAHGIITRLEQGRAAPTNVPKAQGPLLPGMPNVHSHAFQRGFAGLTEFRSNSNDSFWTWREAMYRFALRLSPAQMETIASAVYAEMLEVGYTHVCEFHYLHHQPDGSAYAPAGEMARAIIRAAKTTGIGLTLLPVLYQTSGFGKNEALNEQRRFTHTTQAALDLFVELRGLCKAENISLGLAPHSLRAVPPQALLEAITGVHAMLPQAPIHIHVAEQTAEVQACLAHTGQRPVAWLLDHCAVDERWCLVHATHMDAHEQQQAAKRRAVAGICPTTEANLGDGIFDFQAWVALGGRWGIGSDSHITVNAADELKLLEYAQRLQGQARNIGVSEQHPHVGRNLWLGAVAGGAQASSRPIKGLAVGESADFIELDAQHHSISGLNPDAMLDSHVFAASRRNTITRVFKCGILMVQDGKHQQAEKLYRQFAEFRKVLA